MKRRDPELEALLERGRAIRRVPDVVSARVLTRARATMTAGQPAPESVPRIPAPGRKLGVALAATFCLAVAGAGAVAALRSRAAQVAAVPRRVTPRPESPPWFGAPERPTRISAPAPPPGSSDAPLRTISIPKRHRPVRPLDPQESYAAELALLQRAQAAYARRDFLAALELISEHARGFPAGRLAEEREVLRVRALAASGRVDEARRAVSLFAERFPRSVVLPRLAEAVQTRE